MPKKVEMFAQIIDQDVQSLPKGLPFNGAIKRGGEDPNDRKWRKRNWIIFLRELELDWQQIKHISNEFGTAIPPPWNLWWSDLPMTYMAQLIRFVGKSRIEDGKMIIPNVVNNWPLDAIDEKPEQLSTTQTRWTMIEDNGVVKSSLMTLGVGHFHNGGDIVVERHWEALLEGLGFENYENNIRKSVETESYIIDRVAKINEASNIISRENERVSNLEKERDLARIEATTAARQSGLNIEQTEDAGACL